jgi:hypothetical protein
MTIMSLVRGLVLIAGFAATWIAGSAASMAATVTVSFTGTIQNIDDPHGLTTYSNNDSISGSLTLGPMGDAPTTTVPPPAQHSVYETIATFNFGPITDSGPVSLETQKILGSIGYFGIFLQSRNTTFLIDFTVADPTNVPLQSLADLPTDLGGILAYLGGTLLSSHAVFTTGPDPAHQVGIAFALDSLTLTVSPPVATTPIPGALLLFVTALGGLGFFARRNTLRSDALVS